MRGNVWRLCRGEMDHTGLRGATQPVGLGAVWSLRRAHRHLCLSRLQSIVNARSRLQDEVLLVCTAS